MGEDRSTLSTIRCLLLSTHMPLFPGLYLQPTWQWPQFTSPSLVSLPRAQAHIQFSLFLHMSASEASHAPNTVLYSPVYHTSSYPVLRPPSTQAENPSYILDSFLLLTPHIGSTSKFYLLCPTIHTALSSSPFQLQLAWTRLASTRLQM